MKLIAKLCGIPLALFEMYKKSVKQHLLQRELRRYWVGVEIILVFERERKGERERRFRWKFKYKPWTKAHLCCKSRRCGLPFRSHMRSFRFSGFRGRRMCSTFSKSCDRHCYARSNWKKTNHRRIPWSAEHSTISCLFMEHCGAYQLRIWLSFWN